MCFYHMNQFWCWFLGSRKIFLKVILKDHQKLQYSFLFYSSLLIVLRSFQKKYLVYEILLTLNVIVAMSFAFGVGLVAFQELVLYLHAIIFLGCAGWVLLKDEHVRVDIFYRDQSNKKKSLVNFIGIVFFLLPSVFVIGWYSIDFILISWSIGESSTEPGGLPYVYIQKSFILLFPALLFLASIKLLTKLWK